MKIKHEGKLNKVRVCGIFFHIRNIQACELDECAHASLANPLLLPVKNDVS